MYKVIRTVQYKINLPPIALARARYALNNKGGGHVYDSQKEVKLLYGIYLKSQHEGLPPFKGQIHITMTFTFPLPKRVTKNKQVLIGQYYTHVPDLDNLIKFMGDISQDCGLFENDCIVTSLHASKVYGEEPSTTMMINELELR